MQKNQKGVNPLIATILLLLVCMAIGGIVWTWLQGFAQEQKQASEKKASDIASCSDASILIERDKEHCFFYSTDDLNTPDNNQVKIFIQNIGEMDLNTFTVATFWADGSSDINTVTLDLEEHTTGVAWNKQGKSPAEIPEEVKVYSVDCPGIHATIKPKTDCNISQIQN